VITMDREKCSWYSWRRTSDDTVVNVRLHIATGEGLWRGADILAAASLDFPGAAFDRHVELEGWETNGTPDPFIRHDVAQELVKHDLALSLWLDATVEALRRFMRPQVPDPVDLVAIAREQAERRDRYFTVTAAAQILCRDPYIRIGRVALLEFLVSLGWVRSERDAFVPAPSVIDGGWLILNDVYSPRSKIAYNKIRVTREGILQLQRMLGGVAEIDFDAPAIPTLVEIGGS